MVYPGRPRGNLSTHLSHTAGLPATGAASLNSHAKIPPLHFYPCRLVWNQVTSVCMCVCPSTFSNSHSTCQSHKAGTDRANRRCHIWKVDKVQAMNFRILSQVPITMVWPIADINGLLVPGLCITREALMALARWESGSEVTAGSCRHEATCLRISDLRLNTNVQTQHAAAAGENPEHCPAPMQHFKTISKTSGAHLVRPCGGVGNKENNVKIIQRATMSCRGVGGTICGGIGHACVFSLVWSGSGYDFMYEGVKGRLCVWKHIDCLSDPYTGPQ